MGIISNFIDRRIQRIQDRREAEKNDFLKAVDEAAEKLFETELAAIDKAYGGMNYNGITDKGREYREGNYRPATKADYLQTYNNHIWTYAVVQAIALSAARTKLKIYKKRQNAKDDQGDEIVSGTAWDLINVPNPHQSYFDFMEAFVSYAELIGDSFAYKEGGRNIKNLWVLRPDYMQIIPDSKTMIKGYKYSPDGMSTSNLEIDEVMHFKYFNPLSELYGTSFISAAESSIILDLNAIKYQKKYYSKAGMIGIYLAIKEKISGPMFERYKQEVNTKLGGLENSNGIPVVAHNAELKTISNPPDKTILIESRNVYRDEILADAGVPPIIINLLAGKETYNNASTQERVFWANTMEPKFIKLENLFNMSIFWPMGYEVEFDRSVIKALQRDETEKAKQADYLVKNRIFTPNEIRAKYYDEAPYGGGDEFPSRNPLEDLGSGGVQKMLLSLYPESQRPLRNAMKMYVEKAALDQYNSDYNQNIELIFAAIKGGYDAYESRIIKNISNISFNSENYGLSVTGLLDTAFANLDGDSLQFFNDLIKAETTAAGNTVKNSFQHMRGQKMSSELFKRATEAMKPDINKWGKISVEAITETSLNRVSAILTKGRKQGWDFEQVRSQIAKTFKGEKRGEYAWSRMIARTETNKIVNMSKLKTAKVAGFKKKIWVNSGKADARDDHIEMAAVGPIDIDKRFPNGMLAPGDPAGGPENLCNCGCTFVEWVE